MASTFDLIIKGAICATTQKQGAADLGIRDGKLAEIGDLSTRDAGEVMDATGLMAIPGVIDTQVHFREPGAEHKEDLATGALCAVLGGVTGVFEMPNTNPNTTTPEAIEDKLKRANGRMWCEHAFYVGANGDNSGDLPDLERMPGVCGVKVFMGASTGTLLVDTDEGLDGVLANGKRRVAIHAEDEPRMQERRHLADEGGVAQHPVWRDAESAILATKRALRLAQKNRRPVHILHVTTADEMKILAEHKDIATVEVTPQHLTLAAPDCYERLGTYAQMNPPIRDAKHREGLWWGLVNGVVDVVGSDHAPHTAEEKAKPYPASPSGMPGVQTIFPLMLHHMLDGKLDLNRLIELTSLNAQRIWGLSTKGQLEVGKDADFTLYDPKASFTVTEDWLASRCGWSPFTGDTLKGCVMGTIIRGNRVMWEAEVDGDPMGQPFQFAETSSA